MNKTTELDVQRIRQDFPMFARAGKPFHYLDSGASSQTPVQVIEEMDNYYRNFRANVHRGMYKASETASERYEAVRRKVGDLIHAREEEIIFTSGTTASLNLLAQMLTRKLGKGDEVVLTIMEHHANLIPWQQLGIAKGFTVKYIPLTADGLLDLKEAKKLIGPRTKIVSVMHVSNVLGTIVPIKELAALAHEQGALFVVDAAQSVGHFQVDVKRLDCDFLAFSAHKMLGPTGTGVLYGKKELLDALEPAFFGGDMIEEVFLDRSTWNETPWKFEAGTPNIAGVIGLGAAVDYLRLTGTDLIRRHEEQLIAYGLERLATVPGTRTHGPKSVKDRCGVISFTMEGVHPHDLATILDAEGVCIRAGHHCAMPLLRELGLMEGAARLSFGIYSTKEDVDALVAGLQKARKIFRL